MTSIFGWVFLVICGILRVTANKASKDKLIFAHVLFRHGDRAPGRNYPNDPYGIEYWPQGWQQLTIKGMRQQFLLGKYLKKRYKKLLDKEYKVQEIYIRSSDKDRALQSVASNLAGFYPPIDDEVWNPNLLWQPIPIHTVPSDDDYLLVVDNPCPTYDAVFINQTQSIIDEYNKEYAEFFNYVKYYSGLTQLDFWSIGDIYDPLWCENQHGLKLPNWTAEIVDSKTGKTVFQQIVDLKTIAKNLKYDSVEKAVLSGGFLLGDILTRMDNVAKSKYQSSIKEGQPTKTMLYSAHDDTVMALLYAMNVVKSPFMVPYAATVFIELYQNSTGGHYVEVNYKNDTPHYNASMNAGNPRTKTPDNSSSQEDCRQSAMIRFTVPGCPDFKCPLATFLSVLSNRTSYPLDKRNADCGIKLSQNAKMKRETKFNLDD